MAVPALIDIEKYLLPIFEDNPSGEDLRWEAEYDRIEAARTLAKRAEGLGSPGLERGPYGWEEVISLGLEMLRERSKDLRIAGFVAEAVARRHGLVGLRDGIRLLHSLQERFWATAHPALEDGDPELREGIYEWLDDSEHLPRIVLSVPLTDGTGGLRYTFLHYQQLGRVEKPLSGKPERADTLTAEGRLQPGNFYRAVTSSPADFYEELRTQFDECREVVEQFNARILAKEHFGPGGPELRHTREALRDAESLVKTLMTYRKLDRVRAGADAEPETTPAASEDSDTPDRARSGASGEREPAPDASERPGSTGAVAAGSDGRIYTVWYGTNRRPVDADDHSKGYTGEREKNGGVHYGACWVAVPKSHRFGSVGSSWWKRWLTLKDDRLRVAGRLSLGAVEYWEEVGRALTECQAEERQALVYLHGYNVSFDEAVIRAAQIGFDLKVPGVTALFSWPSRGTFDGYPADEASIEASATAIKDFLVRMATESGAGRVHIVAHSMGNRGLLGAVQRIQAEAAREAGVRFGQVFLAAPDVDVDVFRELADGYPRLAERTTLYISRRDRAVVLSRWLHGYDRVGYVPPVTVVEGIDSVEVGDIDLTALGHGYFAEAAGVLYDMYHLLRHNEAPELRLRLRPMQTPEGLRYWAIGP
jgi:type VI secretion system ImpA family protein